MAASSPYDVETSVKNNWDNTYGTKTYSQRSGQKLVYDVYSSKYISGGYQIVNKDFGNGNQPYINFRGWAVLMGYKHHTSSNHETYIVARKTAGDSGVGTTYVYGTLPVNISATEDLEYNNQGSGVWNECSSSSTKKDNQLDCNMRYDNVGFNAFLPLKQLFPSKSEKATWKLYIVKRVDNHIVWDRLILPFTFDNRTYNGGEISLTSGLNASTLKMIGTDVLRRSYPRETASSVINTLGSDRYFTTDNNYTRLSSDETETAVWYGVRSPHDNNATKWANTAYWQFSGSQAVITYIPENTPPEHIFHAMYDYKYQNGNDYWVQPGDQVYIRLRQRDRESGNMYQYLRLDGSGLDVRSQHKFYENTTYNNQFRTSSHVVINSAKREENNEYGKVKWGVIPYKHGHSYNVLYYYTDYAGNHLGYNDTYMNLRVDGVVPEHISNEILNYRYQNGNDYWVRPNDSVEIKVRQRDPDSGNRKQYIRLIGEGLDVRSEHRFYEGGTYNNHFRTSSHVSIDSAYREENTSYGKVKWTVTPKTHGHSYDIQYYFQDNVYNSFADYIDTGKNLRVDGQGPEHLNEEITDYRYKEHNTYWVRPYDVVNVILRSSDPHSGLKESTLSTGGGNNRVVAKHFWNDGNSTNLTLYDTSPEFDVLSVARTYQSGSTKEVTFSVQGYNHGASHIIRHRYIPTSWSNWSSSSDYVVKKTGYGEWYLHVQAEDNVGNTVTVYKGPYKFNDAPVADFTANPNPTDRITDVKFTDNSSDPNGNSISWDWDYRKKGSSTWINMSTSTNPKFIFNELGTFEVKLTVTDIHGASNNVVKEIVVNNLDPHADFNLDKGTYFIGDTVNVTGTSSDPEGDTITYQYTIKAPDGAVTSKTTPNFTFVFNQVGNYEITLVVRDEYGAQDTIKKVIFVQQLTLTGYTDHTPEWMAIHQEKGNLSHQYYSGETILLRAEITDYTANYVRATLNGRLVNGNVFTRTVTLTKQSNTVYVGEFNGEDFVEKYQLQNGNVPIEFEVEYINGQIRNDTVTIEIIGNALSAFSLHRLY